MDLIDYFNKFRDRIWHATIEGYIENVEDAVNIIYNGYLNDRRIFIIGNGGSAANASHFAQDLAKGTMPGYHDLRDFDGSTLHTISLCDNISFITAIANDDGYENIFLEQLRAHLPMPNDILIAISGSGNSPNILKAVKHFQEMHAPIISFTGFSGGRLKQRTSCNIHFPFDDMCMTEAYHQLVMHYIVEKLRELRIKDKNDNKSHI